MTKLFLSIFPQYFLLFLQSLQVFSLCYFWQSVDNFSKEVWVVGKQKIHNFFMPPEI